MTGLPERLGGRAAQRAYSRDCPNSQWPKRNNRKGIRSRRCARTLPRCAFRPVSVAFPRLFVWKLNRCRRRGSLLAHDDLPHHCGRSFGPGRGCRGLLVCSPPETGRADLSLQLSELQEKAGIQGAPGRAFRSLPPLPETLRLSAARCREVAIRSAEIPNAKCQIPMQSQLSWIQVSTMGFHAGTSAGSRVSTGGSAVTGRSAASVRCGWLGSGMPSGQM